MTTEKEHVPTPPDLVRDMPNIHALAANQGNRNGMEQRYWEHHHRFNGVRLRSKYRPPQYR